MKQILQPGRPPYEWRGLVAIILAVAILVSIIGLTTGSEHLNPEEATTLSTVLGALTGALATFIGVPSHNGNEGKIVTTEETEPQTPEPETEPSHSGAEETEGEVNGPNQSMDTEPELEQPE